MGSIIRKDSSATALVFHKLSLALFDYPCRNYLNIAGKDEISSLYTKTNRRFEGDNGVSFTSYVTGRGSDI